jgi:hypothetical protein
MAISKQSIIDQIVVEADGVVLVRETTTIFENGDQLSKSYHRTSLLPGSDVSQQPTKVKNICDAAWTSDVVSAYQNNNR